MGITVYSKPKCVQCDATTREMDNKGIVYNKVDVSEDAEALAKITALGYRQAPVVITDNDHWSGFRPDKIKTLAA